MNRVSFLITVVLCAVLAACGGGGGQPEGSLPLGEVNAGSTDSGSTGSGSTDSGSTDSGSTDSGSTDSGSTDSGSTDSGSTDSGSTDTGSGSSGVDYAFEKYVGKKTEAVLHPVLIQKSLNDFFSLGNHLIDLKYKAAFWMNLAWRLEETSTSVTESSCDYSGNYESEISKADGKILIVVNYNQCDDGNAVLDGQMVVNYDESEHDFVSLELNGVSIDATTVEGKIRLNFAEGFDSVTSRLDLLVQMDGENRYFQDFFYPPFHAYLGGEEWHGVTGGNVYYENDGYLQLSSMDKVSIGGRWEEHVYPIAEMAVSLKGYGQDIALVRYYFDESNDYISSSDLRLGIELKQTGKEETVHYQTMASEFPGVEFSTNNANAPVAVAELLTELAYDDPYQSPLVIDGRGSSDSDHDYLFYKWELIEVPEGSVSHKVENDHTPLLVFQPGKWGTYKFGLSVFDGSSWSPMDTLEFSYGGYRPEWSVYIDPETVKTGYRNYFYEGLEIRLSANIYDAQYVRGLEYEWTLLEKPETSELVVHGTDLELTFTPDVKGSYRFELVTTDERGNTAISQTSISIRGAEDSLPLVKIEGARLTNLGDPVSLDASGSSPFVSGPEVDVYSWRITSAPDESSLLGTVGVQEVFGFSPDKAGIYEVLVTVANRDFESKPWLVKVYVNGSVTVASDSKSLDTGGTAKTLGTYNIASGDVDSDGNSDLVFVESLDTGDYWYKGNYLGVYLGDGNGQFQSRNLFPLPGFGYSIHLVEDLDGDGTNEIVAAHTDGIDVLKYSSLGVEVISTIEFENSSVVGVNAMFFPPVLADLNSDGRTDIAWRGSIQGTYQASINVAFQKQDGSFSSIDAAYSYEEDDDDYSKLLVFDRGGQDFLAIKHLNDDPAPGAQWSVRFINYNDVLGNLAVAEELRLNVAYGWGLRELADLDGDSNPDALLYSSPYGGLSVSFDLLSESPINDLLDQVRFGKFSILDLNTDGRPDIVGSHSVFLQDSSGGFGAAFSLSADYFPSEYSTLSDFNNDGLLDKAVVSSYEEKKVDVWFPVLQ